MNQIESILETNQYKTIIFLFGHRSRQKNITKEFLVIFYSLKHAERLRIEKFFFKCGTPLTNKTEEKFQIIQKYKFSEIKKLDRSSG